MAGWGQRQIREGDQGAGKAVRFVTIDEVLAIHDRMLAVGGGRGGIHDFTLLHSAVERPKAQFGGKFLYPSLWLAAAALLQSLVKNHPFEDGNKRTAYFSAVRSLRKNGYLLELETAGEIVRFMVKVDTANMTIKQIAAWLKKSSRKIRER